MSEEPGAIHAEDGAEQHLGVETGGVNAHGLKAGSGDGDGVAGSLMRHEQREGARENKEGGQTARRSSGPPCYSFGPFLVYVGGGRGPQHVNEEG